MRIFHTQEWGGSYVSPNATYLTKVTFDKDIIIKKIGSTCKYTVNSTTLSGRIYDTNGKKVGETDSFTTYPRKWAVKDLIEPVIVKAGIEYWIGFYGSNQGAISASQLKNPTETMDGITVTFLNSIYVYYKDVFPSTTLATAPNDLYLEFELINKYLFQDGNNVKKYKDSTWEVIGTIPVTKKMIDEHGMLDLSVIDNYAIQQQTSDTPELICWTQDGNEDKTLKINAIPPNQLVYPTKDINIHSIENIDSVKLTEILSGLGKVRIITSFNEGATWYAHNGTEWIEVSPIVDEAIMYGMSPAILANIVSTQWAELRGNSNTMRFAYALSIEDTTDVAEIDALITQMDMKGTWKKAVHGKDYDYEYSNNDELLVIIYADGDYKINY